MKRCAWVTEDDIYIKYHDEEWGNFDRFTDDDYLFEMLTLEGAQAGLSWITILKRRENYRKAFDHFKAEMIQNYDEEKIKTLLEDKGIIRNERKVRSVVKNAAAFIAIQKEYGSFHTYLKELIGEPLPIYHSWEKHEDVPAETELSRRISKALKKRGFSFVGPVIIYSFMQAVGIVNDHTKECALFKGGN